MKLLTILILLVLISACENNESLIEESSNTGEEQTPAVPLRRDNRLLNQPFEISKGEYIEFTDCVANNKLCNVIYENELVGVECSGTARINADSTVTIWGTEFYKPECKSIEGDYKYSVVSCQGYNQIRFICGRLETPYDLILIKI